MQLYRSLASLDRCTAGAARVVAVGVFDGLHIGHEEILAQLKAQAAALDCRSLVFSFEPMPTEFFFPENPPPRLTRFRERFERLAELGIEELFCPRFERVRDLSTASFIDRVLLGGLNAKHVVVGDDFRFAAGRAGTVEDLKAAGRRRGFGVTTVPAVFLGGERVSSTAIRHALRAGDLGRAAAMLGRPYSMSGRVVRGLGLGKTLGFPTANVHLKRRQTPIDGIFAARVSGLRGRTLDGVASVGTRPTVGGGEPLLEVFIFDFERDIYGEHITVHFIERLREERVYPNLGLLKAQIREDVVRARAALGGRIA
jgi:riboflavin kinase / FMN adenylyltransferase